MQVYVAGFSRELARVVGFVREVRRLGHTITFDWTAHVQAVIAAGKIEATLSTPKKYAAAYRDLQAIRDADLVILLLPSDEAPTRGAWVEYGFALGIGRDVWVTAENVVTLLRSTIFVSLGDICTTDNLALDALASGLYKPHDLLSREEDLVGSVSDLR